MLHSRIFKILKFFSSGFKPFAHNDSAVSSFTIDNCSWLGPLVKKGFPRGSLVKDTPAVQETQRQGFDSWVGKAPGGGNGNALQHPSLENPMDREAWWAAVHEVAKSWTQLSDFTFTFHFHALEKEMATHSSVLAWRIPGTGESGGLPSMGSHRVKHD